jgi:hypothetical protein
MRDGWSPAVQDNVEKSPKSKKNMKQIIFSGSGGQLYFKVKCNKF